MPELPEVELAARGLRAHLDGRRVVAIDGEWDAGPAPLLETAQTVLNRTCLGVRRRGKRMAVDFSESHTLLLHLGMTGRFVFDAVGSPPPRHQRFALVLDDATVVRFVDQRRFGDLQAVATAAVDTRPGWSDVGPDVFEAPLDRWTTWLSVRGPIKPALLHQHRVSGIGNIYACEGLYRARISPIAPAFTVAPERVAALRLAIVAAMNETLERDAAGLSRYLNEGDVENPFQIYGRESEPCPRCAAPIERIAQAGRSTWHCPACQPNVTAPAGGPFGLPARRKATSRRRSRAL